MRLTTPGVILAIVAAILLGTFAAFRLATGPDEALVQLDQAPKAGPQHAVNGLNAARVYEARVNGVVTIEAMLRNGDMVSGSGFVATKDGYIVTAYHVAVDYAHGEKPQAIYVVFASNDRVKADLVGLDGNNDIAVLKVNPDEVPLAPVPMGNSDRVLVGEPVAAIGAPFGHDGAISTGIVANVGLTVPSRINEMSSIADAIQTDAAINKGNSGGPLLNSRGQVIGINQQIDTETGVNSGVAFAIPINTIKHSMRQIIKTGSAHAVLLGLNTATVSPQLARRYGLKEQYGVVVAAASGPAEAAGISGEGADVEFLGQTVRMGDHIVSIAHSKVTSKEDVSRIASRLEVGQTVEVTYFHAGTRKVTNLVTQEKL